MNIPLKNFNKLPHRPGVYIYRDSQKQILYIGKAIDLSKRVRQYFSRDDAIGDKTQRLVSQIATVEVRTTPTEFDALLLEAQLIRTFLPKYNVIARDDKSPLYVAFTLRDPLPRILLRRKTQLSDTMTAFGPFQSGKTLRDLLARIRHIIPYCAQKQRNGRPCFYTHIGLCDPCPSFITSPKDKLRYRKNILRIRDIFVGKAARVISALQKEMEAKGKQNQFEEAQKVKQQLLALIALGQKRLDPMLYLHKDTDGLPELRALLLPSIPTIGTLSRIECIDISNTSGTLATGSLVVLIDGIPDTSQYRRFKIKQEHPLAGGSNDPAMIAEVLIRRLAHLEWPFPDLLVVDGGKSQVAAAKRVTQLPLIGLAKRFEEIIIQDKKGDFKTLRLPLNNPAIHVLQWIRNEAHRFAKGYHVLLRQKLLDTIEAHEGNRP